jgi:Icc protein
MRRLAWVTDIHLNFLQEDEVSHFCKDVLAVAPDGLLVTGDISEAPSVEAHLAFVERELRIPVYSVLGNHDYYRGSIAGVREAMRKLGSHHPHLTWMPNVTAVPLSEKTVLIGHDGWADGRFGDFIRSRVMLNDYLHIEELAYLPKATRLERLHALGDEAAAHFRSVLPEALERFRNVIVATHVPPFEGACWHDGKLSDDEWLPHFSCRATGAVLLDAMTARKDRHMTVYCGHTHSAGVYEALPNLRVYTGHAKYGAPAVQRVIEVD